MRRAERRRAEKAEKKKAVTYNYNKEQAEQALKRGIEKEIQKVREEAREEAINIALTLLLTLPLEVLIDHYWKKSYTKKIPQFTEYVIE